MVLYSRLHLITQNSRLLRSLFWTIIATGISCNLPIILNISIPSLLRDTTLFNVLSGMEIAYTLQEIVLSSMYIYLFYQFACGGTLEPRDCETMILLILAQIVIFISDVATTVLIYVHFYFLRMVLASFTYAIKLRLEFVVLNRLSARRDSVQDSMWEGQHTAHGHQQLSNRVSGGWQSCLDLRPGGRGLPQCGPRLELEVSEWPTRVGSGEQWISGQGEGSSMFTTPKIFKPPLSGCNCRNTTLRQPLQNRAVCLSEPLGEVSKKVPDDRMA